MKLSVDKLKSNPPKMLSKREDKKGVNISWNQSLFFQIGLIISLIAVFFIMESSIGYQTVKVEQDPDFFLEEPPFFTFDLEIPPAHATKKLVAKTEPQRPKQINTVFTVKSNLTTETETPLTGIDAPVISKTPLIRVEKPVDNGLPRSMINVEFVPVFPGCENLTSNAEKITCMSSKIGNFINKNFRTSKFDYLASDDIHKVYVQFKIDKLGNITEVFARAANPELEKEGIRVVEKLPKMKPGRQGNLNVDVMYTVPILFKVN